MRMTGDLSDSGCALDWGLIYASAMLHDIARAQADHAATGADWVAAEGYGRTAEIIASHHDLREGEYAPITEKTVVFLSDKLIAGDLPVTLGGQIARGARACGTLEALNEHKRQYAQAKSAYARIVRLIGRQTG